MKKNRGNQGLSHGFSCSLWPAKTTLLLYHTANTHNNTPKKKRFFFWLCNDASYTRFLRGRPRCLCPPPPLLAVLLDDRLLHSSETFHEHVSWARKVDPYVPLPEEGLSVGKTYPGSLELQCWALPAASSKHQHKIKPRCPDRGKRGRRSRLES